MIMTTTEEISGKRIIKTLGMVCGNTIRARHFGRAFMARVRGMVGGEIPEYTKVIAEAREQSLDRMAAEAEKLGANAIVAVRFGTTEVMAAAAEILAYGTAVIIE
jgi:uncharacterized protein YbjQ (UPF0145 family)